MCIKASPRAHQSTSNLNVYSCLTVEKDIKVICFVWTQQTNPGNMKAVYIVNDPKVAAVLIDPMRRAILDLLRQRPMTQAQLANELGLSGSSLNFHIKRLRAKKLVVIAKREIEKHRIMQIFFVSVAYMFVYDLESLPKNIARYFYPISLERARTLLSASSVFLDNKNSFDILYTYSEVNRIAEDVSRLLVKTAKHYQNKEVEYGEEKIVNDIYKRCISLVISKKQIGI